MLSSSVLTLFIFLSLSAWHGSKKGAGQSPTPQAIKKGLLRLVLRVLTRALIFAALIRVLVRTFKLFGLLLFCFLLLAGSFGCFGSFGGGLEQKTGDDDAKAKAQHEVYHEGDKTSAKGRTEGMDREDLGQHGGDAEKGEGWQHEEASESDDKAHDATEDGSGKTHGVTQTHANKGEERGDDEGVLQTGGQDDVVEMGQDQTDGESEDEDADDPEEDVVNGFHDFSKMEHRMRGCSQVTTMCDVIR